MKILATAPIDQTAIDILSAYGEIITAPNDEEQTLIDLARDVEVIVVRGVAEITEAVIQSAKHLKVIGRTGVGINNINIEAVCYYRDINPHICYRSIIDMAICGHLKIKQKLAWLVRFTNVYRL